jgi:hypothetical protein
VDDTFLVNSGRNLDSGKSSTLQQIAAASSMDEFTQEPRRLLPFSPTLTSYDTEAQRDKGKRKGEKQGKSGGKKHQIVTDE